MLRRICAVICGFFAAACLAFFNTMAEQGQLAGAVGWLLLAVVFATVAFAPLNIRQWFGR